ncbi:hypothetical protein MRX96_042659 [Rhipicephalus microplus]
MDPPSLRFLSFPADAVASSLEVHLPLSPVSFSDTGATEHFPLSRRSWKRTRFFSPLFLSSRPHLRSRRVQESGRLDGCSSSLRQQVAPHATSVIGRGGGALPCVL